MPKNTRMQRGKSGKGTRQNNTQRMTVSHPPQIDGYELRHATTMRFIAKNLVATGFTFQNLLDTFLVATTAIAVSDVFQTVRVRRVRVWAVPVIGGAASVTVEFAGTTAGVVGDQAVHADTSMGIQPAHVDARPSARSLASDYQLASGAVAFIITAPAGSVVDVELSFRGQFAANSPAANASVGATPGGFYLRGLDGLPLAATNFNTELIGATDQI